MNSADDILILWWVFLAKSFTKHTWSIVFYSYEEAPQNSVEERKDTTTTKKNENDEITVVVVDQPQEKSLATIRDEKKQVND